MPTADIDGTMITYEIIGDDGPPWVVTPGGRFGKDAPGIRELAQALAAHRQRVLIWDRPNCGASDVCFTGASESQMQADKLAGLLRSLDMMPAVVMGGSGGSRVSLLTAVCHPDVTAKLAMVWISGGTYGLLLLAVHYCGESVRAAWQGGMEAVVALPEWAEVLDRNPGNRARFLALDPRHFIETLERWMLVYCPEPSSTVPGLA
ncbi:MAG TPA: alpha/beta hydrolase, partial [Acidimicrobiia bacterium]